MSPSTIQKSSADIFRAPNRTRLSSNKRMRMTAAYFRRLGANFNIAQHRALAEVTANRGSLDKVFLFMTIKQPSKFNNAPTTQLGKAMGDEALFPATRKDFNNCCFFHSEHG